MFALLIGIDLYESNNLPFLSGAVADARAFNAYLQKQLNVPQDHIIILENESASRDGIIKGLQCLANDKRIQRGDPILIFYAGRGSEATAPRGWDAGRTKSNIQLILPYDVFCKSGQKVVAPIPDRTFGALLELIAQEKGDNVAVVLDSCYSASETKSFNDSDFVRSAALPPYFQIQENLDQDIWSFLPAAGLRSHVLLSASDTFGLAWECNGRGVFTAALLHLFQETLLENLRYCDIPMRIDMDYRKQSPYCDGFNRERYIFSSTSSPSRVEFFIPALTRITKNGRFGYILNGGAAHGLVVGDEFAIYPDMDCPQPEGTLVVDEVGSFYSIMLPADPGISITGNSVAVRVKEGKRQPLRVYSSPGDKVHGILSLLQDSGQDFSNFILTDSLENSQIDISVLGDQAIVRTMNTGASSRGFYVEPTTKKLERILKLSSQFFYELDRTAYFPDIHNYVQVEIHELRGNRCPFASTGAVPSQSNTLRQSASYGLKLVNNSIYDLYPIVQYFDPSNEFKFDTWYRPTCSRSVLDVPLKKGGGTLSIGYGYGGSPPLTIPLSDAEGRGFLKVSLFTRPLDPFYQARSFRFTRYLPEYLRGPWATITKPVPRPLQWCPTTGLSSIEIFPLGLGLTNTKGQRSTILCRDEGKGYLSSVTTLKSPYWCPIQVSLPPILQHYKPGFLRPKKEWFKLLWKRTKTFCLRDGSLGQNMPVEIPKSVKLPMICESGGPKSKIQVLVPQDYYSSVKRPGLDVPDQTIGALLGDIAEAKGDNISGHSFSGTTGPSDYLQKLFALIIGIDLYDDPDFPRLRGAVRDAFSYKEFLTTHLKVPENQIQMLIDRQASRAAILEAFTALKEDPRINKGDPVFIFYAGHGAQLEPLEGPEPGGSASKLPMLVPQDYCSVQESATPGIPDRTIAALLEDIAEEKGNNITVVLDCCGSSSDMRIPNTATTDRTRSVNLKPTIHTKDLDREIWDKAPKLSHLTPKSRYSGLGSHILLAACDSSELAKESAGHGRFSAALLKLLRTVSPDELRYSDILTRIDHIAGQNPQIEGINLDRYLFDAKVHNNPKPLIYPLHSNVNLKLIAGDGGAPHDITQGNHCLVLPWNVLVGRAVESVLQIHVSSIELSLFALLEGTGEYKAIEISRLRGAFADTHALEDYLSHLNVPSSQMSVLLGKDASRFAKANVFRTLQHGHSRESGEAILILFVGRGGESPLSQWNVFAAQAEVGVKEGFRVDVHAQDLVLALLMKTGTMYGPPSVHARYINQERNAHGILLDREEIVFQVTDSNATRERFCRQFDLRYADFQRGPKRLNHLLNAVTQPIAELCHQTGNLDAKSFARSSPGHTDQCPFVHTLAFQVTKSIPNMRQHIAQALGYDPASFDPLLEAQMETLVLGPSAEVAVCQEVTAGLVSGLNFFIIINGLDECDESKPLDYILSVLSSSIRVPQIPPFILTASPSERQICQVFNKQTLSPLRGRIVLDDSYNLYANIEVFLTTRLNEIKGHHSLRKHFPYSRPASYCIADQLIRRSSDLFIYAPDVMKFVESRRYRPTKSPETFVRLETPRKCAPFAELDALYFHIFCSVDDIKRATQQLKFLLLTTKAWRRRPHDVEGFLYGKRQELQIILCCLHSNRNNPLFDESSREIRLFHASLQNFQMDEARSGFFLINSAKAHASLAQYYFERLPTACVVIFGSHHEDDLYTLYIGPFDDYLIAQLSHYVEGPASYHFFTASTLLGFQATCEFHAVVRIATHGMHLFEKKKLGDPIRNGLKLQYQTGLHNYCRILTDLINNAARSQGNHINRSIFISLTVKCSDYFADMTLFHFELAEGYVLELQYTAIRSLDEGAAT